MVVHRAPVEIRIRYRVLCMRHDVIKRFRLPDLGLLADCETAVFVEDPADGASSRACCVLANDDEQDISNKYQIL